MTHRASLAVLLLVACGGSPNAKQTEAPPPVGAPSPAPMAAEQPAPAAAEAASPAREPIAVPPALQAVVDAADRSAEDRALDAGRRPGELLAFLGVEPGMKVAEISAGGGYTAELLARAVGPKGVVYGMNVPFVLERFAEKPWSERLKKPVNKNIVRVDRAIDDPLPAEAKNLDLVVNVLFYHDLFWLGGDRDAMNRAIFKALKPGGHYVIVDHSGRPGSGTTEVQTLHRIEEKVIREEVERAGFVLVEQGHFLRSPEDSRDWNASPREAGEKRGQSDRFALKFAKR